MTEGAAEGAKVRPPSDPFGEGLIRKEAILGEFLEENCGETPALQSIRYGPESGLFGGAEGGEKSEFLPAKEGEFRSHLSGRIYRGCTMWEPSEPPNDRWEDPGWFLEEEGGISDIGKGRKAASKRAEKLSLREPVQRLTLRTREPFQRNSS